MKRMLSLCAAVLCLTMALAPTFWQPTPWLIF